jgi:hypothetical protein
MGTLLSVEVGVVQTVWCRPFGANTCGTLPMGSGPSGNP